MNAIDMFEKITSCESDEPIIEGKRTRLKETVSNDYLKDDLLIIPAGTELKLQYAGDFGCYAIAEVEKTLYKVKIQLKDIMKIDWSFLNETTE